MMMQQMQMHPLAQARAARDWTRTEAATRLREYSRTQGKPLETGKDGIYRWEHGRVPDPLARLLLAGLFGIPADAVRTRPWPDWLSEDPARRPTDHPWDAPGTIAAIKDMLGDKAEMDVNRRDFTLITGATLTSSLLAWFTADPATAGQITTGRRIGESVIARIEDRVQQLRHADDADGGGEILTETANTITLITRLLTHRSYTDTHGARLHAAVSDLSRQAGWAALDVHQICADRYFDAALRAAHTAGDPSLGANALAFWSIAAYNNNRPADAEQMATAALAATRRLEIPRLEAMLRTRRARALTYLNDDRCWRELGTAETLLDRADTSGTDGEPEWVYWFNRSELLSSTASCHLERHQPHRAQELFAAAAQLFPPEWTRTRAIYLTRQANAQLQQGDLDHCCSTASSALDLAATVSSRRTIDPLLKLLTRMRPYETNSQVRDLRERARTTLAA